MKNLMIPVAILILAFPNLMISQKPSEKEKAYKNEFGTDLTGLIEQIFNFNQSDLYSPYYPYESIYQVVYKRHFNKFSIRFGLGGSSNSSEKEASYSLDDGMIKTSYRLFNYRLGAEWNSDISKRWNFYYGIDFRQSYDYYYNDAHHYSGGYRYGSDDKTNSFGLAPLMGIEFRLNNRIALQTEASFVAYITKTKEKPIIKQISDNPSDPFPSTETEEGSGQGTGFSIPNFIVISIRI